MRRRRPDERGSRRYSKSFIQIEPPVLLEGSAGGKFEVFFRFYGPEKPLFEKTWVLPDIEQVK